MSVSAETVWVVAVFSAFLAVKSCNDGLSIVYPRMQAAKLSGSHWGRIAFQMLFGGCTIACFVLFPPDLTCTYLFYRRCGFLLCLLFAQFDMEKPMPKDEFFMISLALVVIISLPSVVFLILLYNQGMEVGYFFWCEIVVNVLDFVSWSFYYPLLRPTREDSTVVPIKAGETSKEEGREDDEDDEDDEDNGVGAGMNPKKDEDRGDGEKDEKGRTERKGSGEEREKGDEKERKPVPVKREASRSGVVRRQASTVRTRRQSKATE
jgi:hypothetical protein